MNKTHILERLDEMALLLELDGANPFKVRAYTNGVRALESLDSDLASLIESGKLDTVKGIGKGLAAHITTLWRDEADAEYADLRARIPDGLLEMLQISGLGPKKVKAIYDQLGIATLGELEYACQENRLVSMKGFGAKTQDNVLKGLELLKSRQGQFLYPFALAQAERLLAQLRGDTRLAQVALAGSLRRRKEVVKDLDLVASCAPELREAIMADFAAGPEVSEVVGQGLTKSTVRLQSGLSADLRLVSPVEFPHVLLHMTGSKEHNTALRGLAKEQGLKINEYGLFQGEERLDCADEAAIFERLGLPWIAPELRENQGEIDWAQKGQLPALISDGDLKGVFHAHSTWSDGAHTLAEMVKACQARGFEYLGITEHSQSAVYAHGLEIERVQAQWAEIDALNATLDGFQVFKGIEVDILPDGQLDYDDALLEGFDFVIASVHSRFKMEPDEMTARILRAAAHPAVTMLGHLTGRILLAREGYPVDVEAVIDACAANGTLIELNAHPSRLDLDWRYGAYARARGLKTAINPDAHSTEGFDDLRYGVGIARKAGFGPADVLNTLTLSELREWLAERRVRRQTAAASG
ncbi:MAG: DNA polymerase/3'-5' exonuclease PolX [Candidatus Sericytochromatia bacterium]